MSALFIRQPSLVPDGGLPRPPSSGGWFPVPDEDDEVESYLYERPPSPGSEPDYQEYPTASPSVVVEITPPEDAEHLKEEEDVGPQSCGDKFGHWYDKYGRHLTPILILAIYSLIGAAIFQAIEYPAEVDEMNKHNEKVAYARMQLVGRFSELLRENGSSNEHKAEIFETETLKYQQILGYTEKNHSEWTFAGALYYVGTVYTTIGYGNLYPRTSGGRLATCLYALFGIPLVLAILSDLGKALCKWVNVAWVTFYKLVVRRRRFDKKWFHKVTSADYRDAETPAFVVIFISLVWLFFCSSFFLIWEDKWTFGDSIYFFFISLTTIGFGDVVPQHFGWMSMMSVLVIIGLSLVSMTINVIQQKIERILYQMMLMIQEEYQKMMEQGQLPAGADKKRLMKQIWAKQPWYVRNLMPLVMGDKQKEALERQVAQVVDQTLPRMIKFTQTDDMTPTPRRNSSVQSEPFVLPSTVTQTEIKTYCNKGISTDPDTELEELLRQLEEPLFEEEFQHVQQASPLLSKVPPSLAVITETDEPPELHSYSMQTSMNLMPEETQTEATAYSSQGTQVKPQPIMSMEEEIQTTVPLEQSACQTDVAIASSNFVQTDIFDSMDTSVQTVPAQVTPEVSQTDLIDFNSEVIQTDPIPEPPIPESVDMVMQTSRESTPMLEALQDTGMQTSLLQLAQLGVQADLMSSLDSNIALSATGMQTSFHCDDQDSQTPGIETVSSSIQADLSRSLSNLSSLAIQTCPPLGLGDAEMQTSPPSSLETQNVQTDFRQSIDEAMQTSVTNLAASETQTELAKTADQSAFEMQTSVDMETEEVQTPQVQLTDQGVQAEQARPMTLMKALQTSLHLDDISTQTPVQFFSNRSMQALDTRPLLISEESETDDELMPRTYTGTQTDLLKQRDQSIQTHKLLQQMSRLPTLEIETKKFDLFDNEVQTEPYSPRKLVELRSQEVQTNDSYLRIARKIHALQHNRAMSLHVMAAGVARKNTANPQAAGMINATNENHGTLSPGGTSGNTLQVPGMSPNPPMAIGVSNNRPIPRIATQMVPNAATAKDREQPRQGRLSLLFPRRKQ